MPEQINFNNKGPEPVHNDMDGLRKELHKYKSELSLLAKEPDSEDKKRRKSALDTNISLLENTLKSKS